MFWLEFDLIKGITCSSTKGITCSTKGITYSSSKDDIQNFSRVHKNLDYGIQKEMIYHLLPAT
jgi:hypothetical protein